jgi:hypothetical protein
MHLELKPGSSSTKVYPILALGEGEQKIYAQETRKSQNFVRPPEDHMA